MDIIAFFFGFFLFFLPSDIVAKMMAIGHYRIFSLCTNYNIVKYFSRTCNYAT